MYYTLYTVLRMYTAILTLFLLSQNLNVGLSRGSKKRSLKKAPEPYHAIVDVNRVSLFFL